MLYDAGVSIGVASDNKAYQRFGISLQREMELLARSQSWLADRIDVLQHQYTTRTSMV